MMVIQAVTSQLFVKPCFYISGIFLYECYTLPQLDFLSSDLNQNAKIKVMGKNIQFCYLTLMYWEGATSPLNICFVFGDSRMIIVSLELVPRGR